MNESEQAMQSGPNPSFSPPMKRSIRPLVLAVVGVLLVIGMMRPWAAQADSDQTGTIAYVNAISRDEIRLVEPDGSDNRSLWAHGQADPLAVYEIWSLDWHPDGKEVAFASNHENWCSINDGDIFVIGAGGDNYRRITQGPSCAGLNAYPKGTVQIPVRNSSIFGNSFSGFIYFQGAPSLLPVNLPAGANTTLTFNNVADFGEGLQLATIIVGLNRAVSIASAVDVKAGETVTTAQVNVYTPDTYWENRSPTWRSDGSQIGYFLNFASMMQLPPHPDPLELGNELQTNNANMPDFADILRWGPPAKANQLLYRGSNAFDSQGVFLITEGSSGAGEQLLSYPVYQYVRGIAWLPDGSGFIFSLDELDDSFQASRANLFEYNFATEQTKRITNFTDQFAGGVSVSPDGQQIVFDRADANIDEANYDVYIINRDGTGLKLLASDGYAPDWSSQDVVIPVQERLYLPSVLRLN